jgi:hypothetical protein
MTLIFPPATLRGSVRAQSSLLAKCKEKARPKHFNLSQQLAPKASPRACGSSFATNLTRSRMQSCAMRQRNKSRGGVRRARGKKKNKRVLAIDQIEVVSTDVLDDWFPPMSSTTGPLDSMLLPTILMS